MLGNDSDADSDPLTAVLDTDVSHGTLVLNANGSFSYTPAGGYTGPDAFTYHANDGTDDSNTVTVSLTVGTLAGPVGQWLADEGSGTTLVDSSGQGNDGALQGNPTWVAGQQALAIRLDGTGDYAVVPDDASLDISGPITIAAWVRPEKVATQYLVKKATQGGTSGYELSLATSGKVFFRLNQAASADTYRINSGTSYPADGTTWMHVAATYDGTTMRIYVNGVEDGSVAGPASIVTNALGLGIGAQPDGVSQLQGAMDDIRVYGRALSAAESWRLPRPRRQCRPRRTDAQRARQRGYRHQHVPDPRRRGLRSDADTLTVTYFGRPLASGTFAQIAQHTGVASGTATPPPGRASAPARPSSGTSRSRTRRIPLSPVPPGPSTPSRAPTRCSWARVTSPTASDTGQATGDIVAGIDGAVWTAGDNVYPTARRRVHGLLCAARGEAPRKSRTRPIPGNHDWGSRAP